MSREMPRILTFRELPPRWQADCVLLLHNAFGSSWDPRAMSRPGFERIYPRPSEYVGVCAVDRGRVVSAVLVHRFPFRTRRTDGICSGLGAVATLPTHAGRGLARSLIEEVHRRERRSGSPFVLLYTGRSIVAHSLYEGLGYHDVLDFPRAARLAPKTLRPLPRGWRWRRAVPDDRRSIEELRTEMGRTRFGFTREGVDWWPVPPQWFAAGPLDWFVLEHDRSIVGYAGFTTEGQVRVSNEGMARTDAARSFLSRSLEREASGSWLVIGSSLFHELRDVPGMRAYSVVKGSYSVLMARSLEGRPSRSGLIHELGTDRPDFLIGVADAF